MVQSSNPNMLKPISQNVTALNNRVIPNIRGCDNMGHPQRRVLNPRLSWGFQIYDLWYISEFNYWSYHKEDLLKSLSISEFKTSIRAVEVTSRRTNSEAKISIPCADIINGLLANTGHAGLRSIYLGWSSIRLTMIKLRAKTWKKIYYLKEECKNFSHKYKHMYEVYF